MSSPNSGILSFFAKYIESEIGVIYAEHNYFQLQSRLEEIAGTMGVTSVEELHRKAKDGINGVFRQLLIDVATNNETSFFRDPKVFNVIQKVVLLPFIEKKSSEGKLRIWSAASSTGQEALSTVILIRNFGETHKVPLAFSILATDISERALNKARAASYTQLEVQRGLNASDLEKYFKRHGDMWRASADLSRHIEFRQMNLIPPLSIIEKFHLVLCRNMLIYQSVEGKRAILKAIAQRIESGGYLVLGSGESLIGISTDFEQMSVDGAIIYRKKTQGAVDV